MSDPTIEVTRYPNRRLYDRSRGQYVTLQELEQLVRDGRTICVRDSKTGEDLTRTILTQIILERFPERMDLIPVPLLHMLLRANDLALDWLRTYLRQSLAFLEQMPGAMLTSAFTPPPPFAPPFAPAPGTPIAPPLDWMRSLFQPWQETPSQKSVASPDQRPDASESGEGLSSGSRPPSPNAATTPEPMPEPNSETTSASTPEPAVPLDNQLLNRMLQLEKRLRELEAAQPPPPAESP